MTLHRIAPGCTFESEDDVVMNPVIGRKKSVAVKSPKLYYRTSELDDIPDNFVERMKSSRELKFVKRNVKL